MANYLDGLPGGKHNSDDTITSFTPKKKKQRFVVISPDGFPIHFKDTYSSIKKAEDALNVWIKNYEHQGYYSSVNWGRIPLNELNHYCQIKQLN